MKYLIILPAKLGLFRNIRETAIWEKQAMAKAVGESNTMKRKVEKGKLKGIVLNKSLLEKSESLG